MKNKSLIEQLFPKNSVLDKIKDYVRLLVLKKVSNAGSSQINGFTKNAKNLNGSVLSIGSGDDSVVWK